MMQETKKKEKDQAKYRLVESMRECMRRGSLESITVDQIVKGAGLSRQTFYRHFKDKYDLVNWYFDKLLLESFDQMGSGRTVREGLQRKFAFIQAEQLFFYAAFNNDDQNNLREHDFEMIYDFYRSLVRDKGGTLSNELLHLLEMYCQASVYMTVQWVLRKLKVTADELVELMLDATPEKIRVLFLELGILDS